MTDLMHDFIKSDRPHIAQITNHGYAGVDIPVGGAPDTGGQNFYVNSLSTTLSEMGYRVTIFARGGFPFFNSDRMRGEPEFLNPNVRYVYIPGGPAEFIRKEDIAEVLEEETDWLENFIRKEASDAGVDPWNLFEYVNTHYWDAAVLGCRLVERWQDEFAARVVHSAWGQKLGDFLPLPGSSEIHRMKFSKELPLCLGEALLGAFRSSHGGRPLRMKPDTFSQDAAEIISWLADYKGRDLEVEEPGNIKGTAVEIIEKLLIMELGGFIVEGLETHHFSFQNILESLDRHLWTPHSLGILKERNFWNKDHETKRKLKFLERGHHEQVVCDRTRFFAATSSEIAEGLLSHHGVKPGSIFFFPPCIDTKLFRARSAGELSDLYSYLAEKSGLDVERIKHSPIVFETSRMDRTKRKDVLLESFAQVASQMEEPLLFIGGGPENDVFRELEQVHAAHPSLKGRAFLLGFVPDEMLAPAFSAATMFVSASEMEGFGMSVSQAAAAGKAVVSSDLIPFTVEYAPDAALIVKAGDVDAFAGAMIDLLKNTDDRKKRAAELKKIASSLDWKNTADRMHIWLRKRKIPIGPPAS